MNITPHMGQIIIKNVVEIIDINNSVNPKSRIERNNQTLGAISLQLRKTIMNLIRKELDLTGEKEKEFLTQLNNKCCGCERKLEAKGSHLDRSKPLASGGTNDDQNIQVLCKDCPMTKSKKEQEN